MKLSYGLILLFLTPFLAGCDQLGLETPAAELAREEAEGKAIGSACRQAGRALEDCYQINRRAPKAAIFAGWRDMDGYMRENKIEEVKPDFPLQPLPRKGRPLEAIEEFDEPEEKKPATADATAAAKPATSAEEKAAPAKPAATPPVKKGKSPLSH
ncbi:MAG: hypothetical protein A3H93_12700 [Rhodocyclales bacterium RIFCSPLOWO2_02_FULL_63_24]|nr:MAG: hypothetical protein A3H93_12700 [Rhodocyclales bacterium RIFCSPLOWO2_02_FULL_63_24]